jgi:hypothetical protein
MLTVNPYKRITAAEALKHPWICVSLIKLRKKLKAFSLKSRRMSSKMRNSSSGASL